MVHRNFVVAQMYAVRTTIALLKEAINAASNRGEYDDLSLWLAEEHALWGARALSVQYPPALPDDDEDGPAAV